MTNFQKNYAILSLTGLMGLFIIGCALSQGQGIIEEVSPSPGSTGLDPMTSITVKTNIPLASSTVESNRSVELVTSTGENIPGEISLNPSMTTLTFHPTQPLPQGQSFQLCLKSGLRTSNGGTIDSYRLDPDLDILTPLGKNACFSFSTKNVLKIRQAFSLTEEQAIYLYFSSKLDPMSIKDADIFWSQGSQRGSVEMRYSPTNKKLTLYPKGTVDLKRPVEIVLPPSISTLDGISLLQNTTIEVYPLEYHN